MVVVVVVVVLLLLLLVLLEVMEDLRMFATDLLGTSKRDARGARGRRGPQRRLPTRLHSASASASASACLLTPSVPLVPAMKALLTLY